MSLMEKERLERLQIADAKLHVFASRGLSTSTKRKITKVLFSAPSHVVVNSACKVSGIDSKTFYKKTRNREHVYARRLASVYMVSNKSYTLSKIGGLLGGYDHATILHHKREFDNKISINDHVMINLTESFLELIHQSNAEYSLKMGIYRP